MVEVSVILLNYDNVRFTLPCIEALKKQVFKDFEIIVVENGSKGDDAKILKGLEGINLICESKNNGFAEGNNIGVRSSSGRYIALLNNDTLPDKRWLLELVSAIKKNPQAGVVGSKAYNKYEKKDFDFCGYATTTLHGFAAGIPVDKDTLEPFDVFSVSGGAMLFRKKEVGEPFDKDYFIYSEDTDLCWRMQLQGRKVLMIPRSTLLHEGETVIKSHKGLSNFFWYLGERNRLLNFFTHYRLVSILLLLPQLLLLEASILIGYPSKIRYKLKGYGWLLWHLPLVLKKRFAVQKNRKLPDRKVIGFMTSRLYDESSFKNPHLKKIASLINKI